MSPLLAHSDEQVQKITISSVLGFASIFAKTMQKSLKLNKTRSAMYMNAKVNVLMVDFTPHFLNYLSRHFQTNDLAYQLFYKLAKKFETSCTELYGEKFIEHLVHAISGFVK